MIWRKWKFWLALVLGATLVGLLEGAQLWTGSTALGQPETWKRALSSTMPSWYVLVALIPPILWLSRRFRLEASEWKVALPVHLFAAATFAIVHVTASSWLSDFVLNDGRLTWSFRFNLARLLSSYFVIEMLTYFAIVGTYHAYEYGRRYREREEEAARLALKASRLEANLTRANLDSLRMQLNPHFLFNTLNAISVMAMKGDRHGVVRMIALVSDLLRLSLDHREQVVPLRTELAFLDRYLEIERVRFGDRLDIERDIAPETLDAEVPSLLLQPIVENALRHGIARTPGPGTVRIETAVAGGFIELRVLDTGPGVRADAESGSDGTGVGLANTRARLEQLYGSAHRLTLETRPEGGARATVRLPLRQVTYESQRVVKESLDLVNV